MNQYLEFQVNTNNNKKTFQKYRKTFPLIWLLFVFIETYKTRKIESCEVEVYFDADSGRILHTQQFTNSEILYLGGEEERRDLASEKQYTYVPHVLFSIYE